MTRVAVVGGGIAGLAAAYELAQAGASFTLFEASDRFGGIVETVHHGGFTIECGPDAWVTEKPWARELATELGLERDLILSQDASRKTYIASERGLTAIPDGMRMMVPADLAALDASPLFSEGARRAYREEPERAAELQRTAPHSDESVAAFVERHFGEEVARTIAAPLLAGVFGGDIARLSVRSVMPAFVKMEREHGSLIAALQQSARQKAAEPIFTTLRHGLESLVHAILRTLPDASLFLRTPVYRIAWRAPGWLVNGQAFDAVVLATPAHITGDLLRPLGLDLPALLPQRASTAVVVALAFTHSIELPPGFGFLVPQEPSIPIGAAQPCCGLLAATFTHQKFAHRVPPGASLLRGFFGGTAAEALLTESDPALAEHTHAELSRHLGPLPQPRFAVVRRWPRSLPQYEVGHQERITAFEQRIAHFDGLACIGNAYHGVGLPDLIRDGRAAARRLLPAAQMR